jgi:hypothetical protein
MSITERATKMPETCRRCHVTYPDDLVQAAFQPKGWIRGKMHPSARYRTCYPCVRTAKDQRKGENRWIVKARDSTHHHALTRGISERVLAEKYGWQTERMARDAARAFADGLGVCAECEKEFGSMGHGYADLTIDICRPDEEPYYGTNTRYICMGCNREKHNMTPERWQLRKRVWAWWKTNKSLPPDELGLLF